MTIHTNNMEETLNINNFKTIIATMKKPVTKIYRNNKETQQNKKHNNRITNLEDRNDKPNGKRGIIHEP